MNPLPRAAVPSHGALGRLLVVVSIVAISIATLTPEAGDRPVRSLCLICGSLGTVDAILNVLLFAPLGIGIALAGWRVRTLAAPLLISTAIELLQLGVIPGRDPSVGDVVTNTLGAVSGYFVARHAAELLSPDCRRARSLAIGWALTWLALQLSVAYAIAPQLPTDPYYGQLGRTFARTERFPGVVSEARVGSVVIPDSRIADSPALARLLVDGRSPIVARVIAGRPTHGVAPILRIADAREQEVLLLAQRGEDLVFALRSGAVTLRLRPIVFAFPNALPPAGSAATLVAQANSRGAALAVRRGAQSTQRSYAADVGYGWVLVLPFAWYITASPAELWLSGLWMALTLAPLGYWLRSGRLGLLTCSIVIATGIAVIPALFALPPSSAGTWLGCAAGAFVGNAAAAMAEQTQRRAAPPPRSGTA